MTNVTAAKMRGPHRSLSLVAQSEESGYGNNVDTGVIFALCLSVFFLVCFFITLFIIFRTRKWIDEENLKWAEEDRLLALEKERSSTPDGLSSNLGIPGLLHLRSEEIARSDISPGTASMMMYRTTFGDRINYVSEVKSDEKLEQEKEQKKMMRKEKKERKKLAAENKRPIRLSEERYYSQGV